MSRDNRLDTIKGVLIILVVLGHLVETCGTGMINSGFRTFIYTFHMPLFILLSGYLTRIKEDTSGFWLGLLNIGIPLIIFQIINTILLLVFHQHVGLTMLIVPHWTLWYLLSLVFWRIMLQFSPKSLLSRPILYLSIAFTVSVVCGLMPMGGGRLLSIQRTFNFFPFLLYGYYMRQGNVPSKPWNNYLSYGFMCLALLLIAFRLYPESSDLLLSGADHYGISQIPSKVYLLICSFVTSLSFFNIMKENKVLSVIGKDSLLYYLYHGIIIRFAFQPLVAHYGLPQSFPFMLIYCVIIVSMIYVMSRVNVFRWLCNPLAKK